MANPAVSHWDRAMLVAEIGVNHNGSLERALEMIDVAAEAGVDAVKFQSFHAEAAVSRFAPNARYQQETTGADESQLEMVRALELDFSQHVSLRLRCREQGLLYISSPFDLDSVDELIALRPDLIKIASGEITNLPLLRRVGASGVPLLLSTGMSTLAEVGAAIDVLVRAGTDREQIVVLQCTTQYPAPVEDANLLAMVAMGDALTMRVGYSDHTLGYEAAIAAIALGAQVIERHFTLDRTLPGPDHAASVDPDGLRELVFAVRATESALGDGVKGVAPSEAENLAIARKSIVAAGVILAGEAFTEANLTVKRPGTGISPMRWDDVIGMMARRDFEPDEAIEL